MKKILLFLLSFYQKYLTVFSYGSCRYYPTCSSYAKIQFKNNNIIIAFFKTFIRILKCNPLFSGGFDYPTIKLKHQKIKFTKIRVKYWLIPNSNGYCYVIENWEKNKT